jgi:hypothetical protein
MATLTEGLPKGCQTCHKASTAAVKMLAVRILEFYISQFKLINYYQYKSRKTIRRIDKLPAEV